MLKVTAFLFTLLMLATVAHCSPGQAHALSGNVPLDSGVYMDLDLLTARGLLRSHLAGTRPITWAEARRLLEEARESVQVMGETDRPLRDSTRKAIQRLEDRIRRRTTGAGGGRATSPHTAVYGPLAELWYLSGSPSPIPGIKSTQHALIYNNEGIDPEDGITGSVSAEVAAGLGPFHLQLFPRLSTEEDYGGVIHRGSLRVGPFAGMDLVVGKESLWWGQGTHGGLYLTNNADPLPMIHLSTPHPSVLPGILRYLGPSRFELFLGRLEQGRAVPEPYLVGLRTDIRPLYSFELGLTMMAMTGGEGRPSVSIGDLLDILFGRNDVDSDRSNNIGGVDLRLTLAGSQFYLEFGGEDEADNWPSKNAAVFGCYFPAVTETTALRLEYADLAPSAEIAAAWYRHGIYTDGYTYNGRILGHHVGGGGRDLFAEVTFSGWARGQGRVAIDLEQRGIGIQPVTERHSQVLAGWKGPFSPGGLDLELDFTIAVDLVDNKNYVSGRNDTNTAIHLQILGGI